MKEGQKKVWSTDLADARHHLGMNRERAMAMVEGVLQHLIDGVDEWPLSMVDEL